MNNLDFANKVRKLCITVAHGDHNVHIGGSLSEADILTVLYNEIMNIDVHNPRMDNRDRFILSKGHSCTGLYATLAVKGIISEQEMLTQYQDGSRISGHISHYVDGIEISTGSLGHGMPIAAGMAYAAKLDDKKHRIFTLIGDGEAEEGSIYETVNFAGKNNLNNLVCIIDYNGIQAGTVSNEFINKKQILGMFKNADWDVVEVNGHDYQQLKKAFMEKHEKPLCVFANTIKGKGISFMENNPKYHSNKLNDEQFNLAMKELDNSI